MIFAVQQIKKARTSVSFLLVGEAEFDLNLRPEMDANGSVAWALPSKQHSPGLLHLEWFKSLLLPPPNKKDTQKRVFFIWWARRDLNPHVRSEH